MSNPGGVKKRLFVVLTKERMKGHITKRDWDLFKRVVEVGVDTLYSFDSKQDKLEDKIIEILNTPNTTDTWAIGEIISFMELVITSKGWVKPTKDSQQLRTDNF